MDDQEVRARLAALPAAPMPPEVFAAIEARLAQEKTVVALTPRHSRRLTWLVAAAGIFAVLALIGLGDRTTPAPVASSVPVVRAGAVFQPAGFGDQLSERMKAPGTAQRTGTFADSPASVKACASSVQAYGRVLFLDVGTYDRQAAVVMITSYPANTEYEEVWVISPTCGAENPVVYRHMVYDVDSSTKLF